MISIIRNSKTDATFVFNKSKLSIKRELLSIIINTFPENKIYLIGICGIDVDRFIENMQSCIYLLKRDERKKIIKGPPKLYVLTNYLEDVKLFGEFINSFNEGFMNLYILKNDKVKMYDEQHVLNFVRENSLCDIEILSDGDVVNLICDNVERIQQICDSIRKTGDGKTGDG